MYFTYFQIENHPKMIDVSLGGTLDMIWRFAQVGRSLNVKIPV